VVDEIGVDSLLAAIAEDTAPDGPHKYAVYFGGPLYIAEGARDGVFEDLTDYIASDTDIIFTDLLPIFRTTLASYGSRIYTILFDGNIHSLFYRADLLDQKGYDVPHTIEDLIEQAKDFNGEDLNEDGEPDFGLCIAFGVIASLNAQLANNVLATFLQTQSSTQGFLFDPETFEPNLDTDPARRGLRLFKELFQEGVPPSFWNGTYNLFDTRGFFLSGRCAFTVDYAALPRIAFYANDSLPLAITKTEDGTNFAYAKELFHTAPWPGSKYVLGPETRDEAECTRALCPYAIQVGTDFVNIAPYNSFGGFGGILSSLVSQQEKDEGFAMLSYWNSPAVSNLDVVDPSSFFEPFRYSQFLPFLWLDLGMSEEQVKAYTIEMRANLENENIALELRVPGGSDYLTSFGENVAKYINDEISLNELVSDTLSKWSVLTESYGGRKKQRDINRELLSLEPIKKKKGGSDDNTVIIVIPTIVGATLLMLCTAFVVVALVAFFLKYKFHVILLPRHAEDTM